MKSWMRRAQLWDVLAVAAAWLGLVPWCCAEDAAARLREMEAAGRWPQVAARLRTELAKPGLGGEARTRLVAGLARALRMQGRSVQGLKVLDASDEETRTAVPVLYERGRCLVAVKELRAALTAFQGCRHATELRTRCLANVAAGDLGCQLEMYSEAIAVLEQVLAEQSGFSGPELEQDEELKEALAGVPSLLEQAREGWVSVAFGNEYWQYRLARRAAARGEFQKAADRYAGIRLPVLADAAGCYRAACLARLAGDARGNKAALAAYDTFINAQPDGLYREEARLDRMLFLVGTAVAVKDWKVIRRQARELLELLDRLEAAEAGEDANVVLENILARSRPPVGEEDRERLLKVLESFAGGREFTERDAANNRIRKVNGPERVVNRLTSPWLVGYVRVQTLLVDLFAAWRTGDHAGMEKALAGLEAAEARDGAGPFLGPGAVPHLRDGMLADALILPATVWARLDGAKAETVRLGWFFYVAGDYAFARQLFRNLLPSEHGPRPTAVSDAARIGVACCRFREGDVRVAVDWLQQVKPHRDDGGLAAFSRILLANWVAASPGQEHEAFMFYREAATDQEASSEVVARAWLSLAVCAANYQRGDLCREAVSQLRRRMPRTAWLASASAIAGLMDADSAGTKAPSRVHDVVKHLIVPGGGGDLDRDVEAVEPGDVLRYRVTAAPRTPCIVVRRFQLRLSELEPQPPPAEGREVTFLRVPLLAALGGETKNARRQAGPAEQTKPGGQVE
ncbi:MAG: hypothetical protein WC708_05715 [Lentisphaeria bacterium]